MQQQFRTFDFFCPEQALDHRQILLPAKRLGCRETEIRFGQLDPHPLPTGQRPQGQLWLRTCGRPDFSGRLWLAGDGLGTGSLRCS